MSREHEWRRFFSDIPEDLKALGWRLTQMVPYLHAEDPPDSDKVKVTYQRPSPRPPDQSVATEEIYVANDSRGLTHEQLRQSCIDAMRRASVNG